jgi:hypothetical protein
MDWLEGRSMRHAIDQQWLDEWLEPIVDGHIPYQARRRKCRQSSCSFWRPFSLAFASFSRRPTATSTSDSG